MRAGYILLISMLGVAAQPAKADVFSLTDEAGITHYTNTPENDQFKLIVATLEEMGTSNQANASPKTGNVPAYASIVNEVAMEAGIDKALVHAVVAAESGYNPTAVSRTGAKGLMQLMPATAKRYAVKDVFDPAQNLRAGAHYLKDLLVQFDGKLELALAAYNAGEQTVLRYGRKIPPYRETQAYVPRVLALYGKYAKADI
ncbi:MAG TPA: transglycosylase [Gallionella sp.]|nr:transglycosylase [Gallionella sp.]